jgi:hypothetical protein
VSRRPFRLPTVLAAAVVATSAGLGVMSTSVGATTNQCTGTVTGGTKFSFTVPKGAACTLVGTRVAGSIDVKEGGYLQLTRATVAGNITAKGAQTVFIDSGTQIAGSLSADSTAQVFVFGTSMSGNIDVDRASEAVQLCGLSLSGNVKIERSGQDILVGDPQAVDCPGNTIRGNLDVIDNRTDNELIVKGNNVIGNVKIARNTGPSVKVVQANRGPGILDCTANAAPFTGTPNPGWTWRRGQCA